LKRSNRTVPSQCRRPRTVKCRASLLHHPYAQICILPCLDLPPSSQACQLECKVTLVASVKRISRRHVGDWIGWKIYLQDQLQRNRISRDRISGKSESLRGSVSFLSPRCRLPILADKCRFWQTDAAISRQQTHYARFASSQKNPSTG